MTEQITSLRSFNHLGLLQTPSGERIYRLIYDHTTRFFQITNTSSASEFRLLEADGTLLTGEQLRPLYEKVMMYERLFGNSLVKESLENWLQIDEVPFLLHEIAMNRPELESRIYTRLDEFVSNQSRKPFYDPFLLPKILSHSDFVYDYLQTNIGHPDGSENYFNRMKIMIQQIGERTAYIEVPSYLRVIHSLLIYLSETTSHSKIVALQGKNHYTILRGGIRDLPDNFIQFTTSTIPYKLKSQLDVLSIDNSMITRLIKIYNQLELEYTRQ